MLPTPRAFPLVRRSCAVALLLSVGLPCTGFAQSVPSSEGPATPRADELFRLGTQLYLQKKTQEAYELFSRAWELKKSYDIAANLAITELALRHHRAAAEHFRYALDHLPPDTNQNAKDALGRRLAEALAEVGQISVSSNAPDSAFTVDGAPVPNDAQGPVLVEPGSHVVAATREGFSPGRQTVTVKKGETVEVRLALTPVAAPGSAPKSDALPAGPPPVDREPDRPLVVAGVLGTFVFAGLGLGFAGYAHHLNEVALGAEVSFPADDAEAFCTNDPPGTYPAACAQWVGLRNDRDTYTNLAIASFVAGAAMAAGTIVYAVVAEDRERDAHATAEPSLRVMPASIESKAPNGILVEGSF